MAQDPGGLQAELQAVREFLGAMRAEMATKEDVLGAVAEMATKEDVLDAVTEMATKEDLLGAVAEMATKEDVLDAVAELRKDVGEIDRKVQYLCDHFLGETDQKQLRRAGAKH